MNTTEMPIPTSPTESQLSDARTRQTAAIAAKLIEQRGCDDIEALDICIMIATPLLVKYGKLMRLKFDKTLDRNVKDYRKAQKSSQASAE